MKNPETCKRFREKFQKMWENSENGGLFLVVALFSDYHSFGYLSIVGDGFHHNEMNYILHRACTVQGPVALAHIVNHLDHAVELDFLACLIKKAAIVFRVIAKVKNNLQFTDTHGIIAHNVAIHLILLTLLKLMLRICCDGYQPSFAMGGGTE